MTTQTHEQEEESESVVEQFAKFLVKEGSDIYAYNGKGRTVEQCIEVAGWEWQGSWYRTDDDEKPYRFSDTEFRQALKLAKDIVNHREGEGEDEEDGEE